MCATRSMASAGSARSSGSTSRPAGILTASATMQGCPRFSRRVATRPTASSARDPTRRSCRGHSSGGRGRTEAGVLAIRPPAGHYAAWQDDLGDLIREAAEKARELGMEHDLVCYGVGNHGGGPTKKSIGSIRALQRDPGQPHALFSTIDTFRAAVAAQAETFPTVIGDLQHHAPGCYTTHSEIKRLNRLAESRLTAAERWCALAFLATGREPETAAFGHAWRQVLFNQFHDTLAGTSLPVAYADARERFGEAFAIAARLENAALQTLAALIDTRV